MTSKPAYLLDQSSNRIASVDVARDGDLFSGSICLDATPPDIRDQFRQFEEMVESQVFTVADEIEDRIAALRLRIAFADGGEAFVDDLQVYPSTNRVSFTTRSADVAALAEAG